MVYHNNHFPRAKLVLRTASAVVVRSTGAQH